MCVITLHECAVWRKRLKHRQPAGTCHTSIGCQWPYSITILLLADKISGYSQKSSGGTHPSNITHIRQNVFGLHKESAVSCWHQPTHPSWTPRPLNKYICLYTCGYPFAAEYWRLSVVIPVRTAATFRDCTIGRVRSAFNEPACGVVRVIFTATSQETSSCLQTVT